MNIKEYLKLREAGNMDSVLRDEPFDDEIDGSLEREEIKDQESVGTNHPYVNEIEKIIKQYFNSTEAITQIDKFADDLNAALSDFFKDKWLPDNFFEGDDDAKITYLNDVQQILDVKLLPKLKTQLHTIAQQVEGAKISAM